MYCSHCGNKLDDDAKFCGKCGAPVKRRDTALNAQVSSPESQQEEPPSRHSLPRKGVLIGVGAGVVAAALVALFVFFLPGFMAGAPGASLNSEGARLASVTGRNGEDIVSLARPKLISFASEPSGESETGEELEKLVSPALARYIQAITQQTVESGSSGASNGSGSSATDASRLQNPFANLEPAAVEPGLTNVVNSDEYNFDSDFQTLLEDNLFAVASDQDYDEYFDLYEMNRYDLEPSFVTVDSIMHTYHLYFAYLLKTTEQGYLYDKLTAVSQLMLNASEQQAQTLSGTEWEDAARRNMIFFGVGLKLLDPEASIPESVAASVNEEIARINEASASGAENAVTSEPEDYTQYKPRGYYEENERLQRYFRAMMWYGRTHFLQTAVLSEGADEHVLNRSALLMTLAMGGDEPNTANADWEAIYAVTSFFAGAADDSGFYEYYPLIVAAYGNNVTVESLPGNTEAWDYFNDLTSRLDPPKISSVIVGDETQVDDDDIKGFRFMGQRFSIDESIYQQLIHDNVANRTLPSALDLPAALGSDEAVKILDEEGKSDYPGYAEQLEKTRTDLANSDPNNWSESLYASWLYTLNPLLIERGEGYPAFMTTDLWDRKDLQSYLSSYTELKHDTVLYSKQVMAEMGGGETIRDDRGYVEPEVEVYGRLKNLIVATKEGLSGFNVLSDTDRENLEILEELTSQLETIATKELKGEDLSDDEFELIRSYGGQLEHFWDAVNPDYAKGGVVKSNSLPAAVVVDIASSSDDGVLEIGTGEIAAIYVIAPVNGELKICRGGVPLYYEFVNKSGERLSDSEWRQMLGITLGSTASANAPSPVSWADPYTHKASATSY